MVECKDFGFKDYDWDERARGSNLPEELVPVKNFPRPVHKMRLVYQSFNQSIEEVYFWLLASLREDFGLHDVKKITDIFTASEQSAFWGQAQQRLTIQQGQVSNYLATIGKLTKELFQIVREMRILDERLALYDESNKAVASRSSVFDRRMSQSAEIVLRSYWVDLKDGGVKSPGSVYGLASTLGYTALPDLFFAAPPMRKEEVDSYVDSLKFNVKVKDVLRKKLKAYLVWKDFTYSEISNRRKFTLKFLRQHYNAIQMYINWVKPYLRNVRRLEQNFTRTMSEDIIGAFEGSVTEIEVVCSRKSSKHCHSVVVLDILFRTQPHMDFHQDGYQHKGPVHVGRSEFTMRGYVWTDDEMANYFRMREQETLDLLGDVDTSLKESIEALGDDLRNYLKEAGEKFPEEAKKEDEQKAAEKKRLEQMKGAVEPFTALFGGFKEVFGALLPTVKRKDKGKPTAWELGGERKKAAGPMKAAIWNTYKNFKKAHRMITW
ncbi:hypothetical protein JW898_02645 [Candidatus Woesearchaeota archaeon]|nr:hypothetical protein [Candidatus Woesearchaeota archaeon]